MNTNLLRVLEDGPCATCARLHANQSNNQIGCSGKNADPRALASQLMSGTLPHELSCKQHLLLASHEIIQQGDVVRYKI